MSFLRTHLRWGVVALLFFTALLNNLDRMVLSVTAKASPVPVACTKSSLATPATSRLRR